MTGTHTHPNTHMAHTGHACKYGHPGKAATLTPNSESQLPQFLHAKKSKGIIMALSHTRTLTQTHTQTHTLAHTNDNQLRNVYNEVARPKSWHNAQCFALSVR